MQFDTKFSASDSPAPKVRLLGLKANRFQHPLDLESTRTLRQIPGIDEIVRALLGSLGEQYFYLENIAAGVRIGRNQLPELHALLEEACAILDLEVPQFYLRQHPMPNAYTFAMRGRQPFVVLHTSLVDLLEPEEIQAVIAHELGHLKCDHGVFLTLANLLGLAAGQLPGLLGTLLAQGLQERMMEWLRCAELTCDRAALLCTQNPRAIASVLMKLAGGSLALAPRLNVDAFIEQARAYDEISESQLGDLLKQAHDAQLSHPVPVLRAREIQRWSESPTYRRLLRDR